jgi:formamidopyrimidine-DNA glycosylase
MPELPEAEANRLAVERNCLHRTIESAEPGDNVTHMELPGENERRRLVGCQFTETKRQGKLVFAGSKTGPWVAVHLGMTGRLIPFDESDGAPDKTKFLIGSEGERRLAFRCPRKLGWLRVVESPEAEIERVGYGPDALAISEEDFADVIGGTSGAIKSALMQQKKMAGVGNLWSDEVLFQTGIHPERKASDLDRKALSEMYEALRKHLEAAVKTEADYSKLPKDWLVRNRDKGTDCPQCGGTITSAKVGGRTAYFCDRHQK